MIISIDPGHGGEPGAIGRHDDMVVQEADVNWAVSMVLVNLLAPDFDVHVSRAMSERILLRERVDRINGTNADLVVSVHCNSADASSARGIESLHFGSVAGHALAQAVHQPLTQLSQRFETPDRGLKVRRRLMVLKNTTMPAVLCELPFVSNAADAGLLMSSEFQVAAGQAIAEGVVSWIENR